MTFDRKAARARCEAATDGPWEWRKTRYRAWLEGADEEQILDDGSAWGEYSDQIDPDGSDADFIAAARTDLPAALDELDDKDAEIERLLDLVTVACEFILATPPCGAVWKERRNAILDEASARGMWKRPDVPRAALEGRDSE